MSDQFTDMQKRLDAKDKIIERLTAERRTLPEYDDAISAISKENERLEAENERLRAALDRILELDPDFGEAYVAAVAAQRIAREALQDKDHDTD